MLTVSSWGAVADVADVADVVDALAALDGPAMLVGAAGGVAAVVVLVALRPLDGGANAAGSAATTAGWEVAVLAAVVVGTVVEAGAVAGSGASSATPAGPWPRVETRPIAASATMSSANVAARAMGRRRATAKVKPPGPRRWWMVAAALDIKCT
jgi:hypothetical protein